MLVPSRRFVEVLKLHPEPAYRVAWRAGVHPNTLSKLISGYLRVRRDDPRIVAVGAALGLSPGECFENTDDAHESTVVPRGALA
jgi:hypothetical protein